MRKYLHLVENLSLKVAWDLEGSCLQADLLGPNSAQNAEVSLMRVERPQLQCFPDEIVMCEFCFCFCRGTMWHMV